MIPTFFLFAFYTVLDMSNNFNVLSVVHIIPLYFNLFIYFFFFLFFFSFTVSVMILLTILDKCFL